MPLFPSPEWIDEFCECLATDPRAGDVAEALDGVYRFVVEPGGALEERHEYDVEIRPADEASPDGQVNARRLATPVDRPRLTMRADYRRWRQLLRGELDIGMAVMLGRLRVSGDLATLTRNLSSTQPLLDALNAVDSQWREA